VPAFLHEMSALLTREYPHIEVVWFGHIGDGNLHINVLRPDELAEEAFITQCEHVTKLLAATLQRHGGSISAEHGIGLVKRAYLESTRGAAEIALMHGVRKVFDPNGILNPGKLFMSD
jgi:FAD/FMN-containing dehydrogenase